MKSHAEFPVTNIFRSSCLNYRLLALLLALSMLVACAALPNLEPKGLLPAADKGKADVIVTVSKPVTSKGAERLNLKGNILLPSGIRQDKAGILLPSGVLLPSGILLPSGFHSQAAEPESQPGFSNVSFKVLAYDQETGELLAETQSDDKGAYVLKDMPSGTKLRLEAQAVNLEKLVLQALADLPVSATASAPVRNLSSRTTAAVLLAQELVKSEGEEIPSSSVQNSAVLANNLDEVTDAVERNLGIKVIRKLEDILTELKSLLAEVKALIQQQKDLLKQQTDLLQDRSYNGIDPAKWSTPTTQLGNYPALPDGTCPPAPKHPDGTPGITPKPNAAGQCPPPPTAAGPPPGTGQPAQASPAPAQGSSWPTTGPRALADGSCPVPQVPQGAPQPPKPTPQPNGFCPPPDALGLPPPR